MLPEEMLELAIGMVQQLTNVLAHLNNDISFKKYIHDVVFAPVYYLRLEVQVQGKLDSSCVTQATLEKTTIGSFQNHYSS